MGNPGLVNPCFVIKNWDSDSQANLMVDGKQKPAGKDFRQGIIRDTDGYRTLIAWIELKSQDKVTFSLSK